MNWVKNKYNKFLLEKLIKYSGVWLEPEPDVWGRISPKEEDQILIDLYSDDRFILLFKKYAERANKGVLSSLNQIELGKFLAFNGLILKAKRAWNDK